MVIRELKKESDIARVLEKSWHDNDDFLLPPMFHGTDVSLINISGEERMRLNDSCETIIADLIKLYKANHINYTNKRLIGCRDSHGHSATAMVMAEARINTSLLYSYGDFYVTNNPNRAISYSQEAWLYGETGWVAKRLIEGAVALGLPLPNSEQFKRALELLDTRRNMAKDPVVLMIENANSLDFWNEKGEKYKDLYQDYFSEAIQKLKSDVSTIRSYIASGLKIQEINKRFT